MAFELRSQPADQTHTRRGCESPSGTDRPDLKAEGSDGNMVSR